MKCTVHSRFVLCTFLLLVAVELNVGLAQAQTEECIDTPEGRICTITQEINQGVVVPVSRQQELGLVTVGGGCSGTLVNRFWVLTADHCVAVPAVLPITNPIINGNLVGLPQNAALSNLQITATWSPRTIVPTRVVRNWRANGIDVALIFLGAGDFGPVDNQLYFVDEVEDGLTLTKYGTGIFQYASVGPPPGAAKKGGYRSARFTSSQVSANVYTLVVNDAGQVGEGGDS